MSDIQNKLHGLKLRKAMIISNIESLSEVDETLFTQLGKVVAEISKIEKQLISEVENIFE